MKKVFKRQNLTPFGMLMVLIAISCDLDRSFVPAVVILLVIGCVLCAIGSYGMDFEDENVEEYIEQEEEERRRRA